MKLTKTILSIIVALAGTAAFVIVILNHNFGQTSDGIMTCKFIAWGGKLILIPVLSCVIIHYITKPKPT